ncbi:helix-turn-helix domain-containing protein [Crystallibacter degradans]|uniref:helix-turn-helix domain-containing protein n=1 Tax=Crystallibacter degradans TaxID=2726743 RepID=UPI00147495B1|nr:XRE family transcriptional regulator [Arthrobacter sp. SF27]NMR29144.1 helix-turn-helix domain-containing protein [Arthrobacter sp. SF27]
MNIDSAVSPDFTHTSDVGQRLRFLRQQRNLTLRQLAHRLGISASALSQMETGRRRPSLQRLHQIVAELGFPLTAVFDNEPQGSVNVPKAKLADANTLTPSVEIRGALIQRAQQAPTMILSGGIEWRGASPIHMEGVDVLRVTYPPHSAPSGLMTHEGVEIVHVIFGALDFEVGGETHHLEEADSIMYQSTTPHKVSNPNSKAASAIWVVSGDNCAFEVGT